MLIYNGDNMCFNEILEVRYLKNKLLLFFGVDSKKNFLL